MGDFLDEIVAECAEHDPEFRRLVEAAFNSRELLGQLKAERKALRISQQAMAQRLATARATVSQLESGEVDATLSTVTRYAAALGRRIEFRLVES